MAGVGYTFAGEPMWVERMIQQHHATARRTCVKIVHCCAYQCIPADLGALMVVDHIRRTLGRYVPSSLLVTGRYFLKHGVLARSSLQKLDLVQLIARQSSTFNDRGCRETAMVTSVVGPTSGGFSGTTLASAMLMAREPAARLAAADNSPYFLCSPPEAPGCAAFLFKAIWIPLAILLVIKLCRSKNAAQFLRCSSGL